MLPIRRRILFAATITAAFVFGVLVGKYLFEPTEMIIPADYHDTLSLLTWKGWSGDLCFLLVPMSERTRAGHDFWSKWQGQCGVTKLKEALAAVPREKRVEWNNSPPKFELPSEKFCDEIVQFAKKEGVQLTPNPSLDTWFSDWQPR